MQPILAIEVPDGMGVGVDEARQDGTVTQIDDSRARGHRPTWSDARNAAGDDNDIDIVLRTAAAVDNCGGTNDNRFL
jgi:hypothetical protein